MQASSPNGLIVVSVTRPGKWGNPFKIGDKKMDFCTGVSEGYLRTVEEVLDQYRSYIMNSGLAPMAKDHLKGLNLACFCKDGDPCHGDILLEIANS